MEWSGEIKDGRRKVGRKGIRSSKGGDALTGLWSLTGCLIVTRDVR